MPHQHRSVVFTLVLTTLFAATGCEEPVNFFLDAAKEVTPVVPPGSSGQALNSTLVQPLNKPGVLESAFQALRDPNSAQGFSNIYLLLEQVGETYINAQQSCTGMEKKKVASPYDLGISDEYDCARSDNTMSDDYAGSAAIRTDGTERHALLTFRWAPDPSVPGHGVMQGIYDEDSGDLSVRMVQFATNDNLGDGGVERIHIDGNAQTHRFSLNFYSAEIGTPDEFWARFVGAGFSQGEGEYFLLKGEYTTVGNRLGYFCIPAGANEAELETIEAIDPMGTETVDPNCAEYQAEVDAMTILDTDDVPRSLGDFAGSSIMLDY